jgi:ribonuclease HII
MVYASQMEEVTITPTTPTIVPEKEKRIRKPKATIVPEKEKRIRKPKATETTIVPTTPTTTIIPGKKGRPRKPKLVVEPLVDQPPPNLCKQFVNKCGLMYSYSKEDLGGIEIGIDEVGRGSLYGRVYIGAVVLPNPETITAAQLSSFHEIRDSKKITSRAKMDKLAEFIRQVCPYWSVQYKESSDVDEINIKQATLAAMANGVVDILDQLVLTSNPSSVHILADGIEFTQFQYTSPDNTPCPFGIQVHAIDKGDNTYMAIACASILAKSTRDTYITDLCNANPELAERYSLHTNMGYGTAAHMSGIERWGVTEEHRRSFAPVARRLGIAPPNKSDECLV